MKHVKTYDKYLNEAATAEVTTIKKIKLKRSIEEKIKLAGTLSKEIKKLSSDFEKKLKPMQITLDKYNKEILSTLQEVQATQATVDDVIARVEKSLGKTTDSYKTLFEKALEMMNDQSKAALLAFQKASQKKNPDKYWMEYEVVEGTVGDALKTVKNWFKDVWKNFSSTVKGWFGAAENLQEVADKILADVKNK